MLPQGSNVNKLSRQGSIIYSLSIAQSSEIVGTSPNRVSLRISTSATGPVLITNSPTQAAATQGFYITLAAPIELTIEAHGALCQSAWYSASAGNTNFGVIEVQDNSLVQE